MKQKIIATIFLFILLIEGCSMGDPILGRWKKTGQLSGGEQLERLYGGSPTYMKFDSNGTCYCVFPGK